MIRWLQPGNPSRGGRTINPWRAPGIGPLPGSGAEFLNWHGGYIERFNKWVTSLPANEQPDQASIQPWTAIPMGFQMGMLGWNQELSNQEQRLRDMSNFATLDDLGIFLEWGLHGAVARMFDESVIMTLTSPRSTYFWQLHGLIENWRQRWIAQSQDEGSGGEQNVTAAA